MNVCISKLYIIHHYRSRRKSGAGAGRTSREEINDD
jgi:hypothetical protein